jgi:hypothetical protein
MTRLITPIAGASAGLVAALTWTVPSLAQDPSPPGNEASSTSEIASPETDSEGAGGQTQPAESSRLSGSHARAGASLVLGGFLGLGLSYGPSLYVANRSGLRADHKLDIPIAGPWLDLGSRPSCAATSCTNEPGYTALLLLDGFTQAISALQMLAGLIELAQEDPAPAAAPAQKTSRPAIVVAPTALGTRGYGLGASGNF